MGAPDDFPHRFKDEQAKLLSSVEEVYSPSPSPENFAREAWKRRERHWIHRHLHVWAVVTLIICIIFYVAWLFRAHRWASPPRYDPSKPRKAVILSSYSSQNTSWTGQLSKDWEIYSYYMDRHDAVYHVPRNFGREVMTYTTYIIDHYDSLPDYMVFTHGHERSWHQAEPMVWKLNSLNITALEQDHYVNLRCNHSPTCHLHDPINLNEMESEDRIYVSEIPKFWKYARLGEFRQMGDKLPDRLSAPCCAQFAVTREAVQRRSLQWWKRYRMPLLNGRVYQHRLMDTWDWGMMYEKLWHVVFGMDPFHCPPERYCFETQWSNGILCNGYPTTPLWGRWHFVWRDITCWENVNNTKGWEYVKWTNNNYTVYGKPKKHNLPIPEFLSDQTI